MRSSRRVTTRIAVAITGLSLMAAGCGAESESVEADGVDSTGESPTAQSSGEEHSTVEEVAFELPEPEVAQITAPLYSGSAYALPAWVADELDLWGKYGLTVDNSILASTQVIPMYLGGEQGQFGAYGSYTLFPVLRQEQDIKLYGMFTDRHTYKFYVRPDIESFDDLRGEAIAISSEGGQPHAAALDLLEEHGIPENEVTFIATGGVGNILPALVSGQVAGGAFGAPYTVLAEEEGMTELADMAPLKIPFGSVGYIGNPSWVEQYPNTTKAYLAAWLEATHIALTDSDLAYQVLADGLELDLEDDSDRRAIEASYEELVTAFVRPADAADAVTDEIVDSLIDLERLKGESMEGIDADDIKPDTNVINELEAEGFFEYLTSEYGEAPPRE